MLAASGKFCFLEMCQCLTQAIYVYMHCAVGSIDVRSSPLSVYPTENGYQKKGKVGSVGELIDRLANSMIDLFDGSNL